jgi:5-methylcytosine-specific restriction endonuclease McrA
MPARRHEHAKLGTLWKVDLRKGGQYARYPLCSDHTALVKQHLPERCRVQMGHTHWFKDPERDLGTRGITNDAAKLMIWSKTAGRCASCDCALSMTEKPRRWHIDHVVPVFRGGRTTFGNLMPMCEPCHRIKSGPERAEAGRTRHREHKARRWLTHPEKDALIASLHSEIDLLRLELAKVRSGHDGDEAGQHRRVPREP